MAQFVQHKPCPKCNSKDNLAVYSDGSWHCFGCGYTNPSKEYLELLQETNQKVKPFRKEPEVFMDTAVKQKPALTEDEKQEIKSSTVIEGNNFRDIRDETYRYFGVRHKISDEGKVQEQYYPVTQDGQLVGYKVREVPKNFYSRGRTGADCDLFMQFRFNRGGKYVVLTEGECLPSNTEVLTQKGWIALEDYQEHHGAVMQANGTFARPLAKILKPYSGKLSAYKTMHMRQVMTPEHNMLRIDSNGNQYKCKAQDQSQMKQEVPVACKIKPKGSLLEAKLLVLMVEYLQQGSNGTYTCTGLAANTVDVLKSFFALHDIAYEEVQTGKVYFAKRYLKFTFKTDLIKEFRKQYSYDSDLRLAPFIIEALQYWNILQPHNSHEPALSYASESEHNVKFIQTCAAVSGSCANFRRVLHKTARLESTVKPAVYIYHKKSSDYTHRYQEIDYVGNVACLTMPDGTLLIKQHDYISCTGNCDSLAAYQMLKDYNVSRGSEFETAVVSPTTGANSKKQIAAQYKFLDSFEQIIVCYDNDKAGKDAIEDIVKVLPKGKTKIMQLRYKDANEYLSAGAQSKFVMDFYNSKRYTPVGVLGSGDLYSKIIEQANVPKVPFPPFMKSLNDMLVGGLPLGYICNIAAKTGIGKTSLINEMIYHWVFHSPHKIGIVSMELDAGQYGEALLGRHLSRKLSLIKDQEEKQQYLLSTTTKERADELFFTKDGQHRFYLLDNRDGSVQEIQDTIEELVVSCGCKIIVLDPLQDILDGLDNEEQSVFMKWCKGIIKSHNVTLILINHVRKSEKGQGLSEEHIHGSSTIIKSAAFNILLDRDKEADDPVVRNTTTVKITKNRVYGLTGPAGQIYYENETNTLHDFESWFNKD